MRKSLEGKTALVAGATRGAGRGIAAMLGEAGAVVYCTGRSSRAQKRPQRTADASPFALESRPETIEDTADQVTARGGKGIAVKVDHRKPEEVKTLFARIGDEAGRLDIIVNDIWGGDALAQWGKPFWELEATLGFQMISQVMESHVLTAQAAAKFFVAQKSGLLIEITDGVGERYRGNLFYDLAKVLGIRLAKCMAEELRPHGAAAVALTPGFLRSEAMLEHFKVREENWQEGAKVEPHFIASETPYFVGRAAAALAGDDQILEKSGKAFSSWGLSDEYGFLDIDGRHPHWGRYYREQFGEEA